MVSKSHKSKNKINKKNSLTSFPRGIPLPNVAVSPMTFATNVLNVRYSFNATPRRIVFISGIPEPVRKKIVLKLLKRQSLHSVIYQCSVGLSDAQNQQKIISDKLVVTPMQNTAQMAESLNPCTAIPVLQNDNFLTLYFRNSAFIMFSYRLYTLRYLCP